MRNAELGTGNRDTASTAHDAEQGFMLLGLIVAIAILLLFLGVAASDAAYSLRREKELESARRADQYWRAIRLFDLKFGRYPPSVEALENTNNVRYLRQRYVDPLTGQADYRMIVVGQNKTTVKGFFGEPLGGIALTAPGAMGGSPAPGSGGATYGGGVNGATGNAGAAGGTGANGPGGGAGGTMGSGTAGTSSSSSSSSGMSPMGSPIGGSGMGAVMGPIMGVGSSASGPSILTVNGQTSYETWEFLYDPRLEQLKLAAALNSSMSPGHPAQNDASATQH